MNWAFDISMKNRKILRSFLENLSLEELNKIPDGYNNNIVWNIAHTVVTQQILVYRLSGLPMVLSNEMIETYKKGTRPTKNLTQADVDVIKGLLFSTIEKTKEDFENKVFTEFETYTVTTKNILTKVEEAIDYNSFHEGIHLGYILALKRAL